MDLSFIDNGTNLKISPETLNDNIKQSYEAIFHDTISATSFFIESEEFHNDYNKLLANKYINITFFRNSKIYAFKGKAEKAETKNGKYLVMVSQLSPIDVATRRQSPRHEILIQINIYSATENILDPEALNRPEQFLFTAQLFDISNEGLCVLTDRNINPDKEKFYFLEFTLNKTEKFILPARLIRKGDCRQSVQFKYDYGFLFDFSHNPAEKQRLVDSIFSHKLSDWGSLRKK